ncbi:DinB family protein [Terrimonas sp. NA20]|uniref:DinB family protein n=1 Tax=Terrimonas ginsenosidimutans TaxID=2908004 RepID=A0ABS9KPY1_9BACT|nr:DinB family protein [Terrimonas ginsenosidimutans]MCG2614369.1 DinB family protein [Terrimonas ginsenosidimutans]
MLQRTKGRLLLALLVITGMAGTPGNMTLSAEERKFCVGQLKKSRNELISSLNKLSPQQLSFHPPDHSSSIQEHIYHLAITEKAMDEKLQLAMKSPAPLNERLDVHYSDSRLLELASTTGHDLFPDATTGSYAFNWPSAALALESFKITRTSQAKYIRNTTENFRNHVVQTEIGNIDCYQLLLIMLSHSNYHLQQIREIMNHSMFPGS